MEEIVLFLRERLNAEIITPAVVAAAGALILWIGLTSVKRVSLAEEAARITGVREPGFFERLQTRIDQSGLSIRWWELLLVGLAIGAAPGALLLLLGFFSAGVLVTLAGPLAYYLWLMNRRDRRLRAFREALPDAIDDISDHIATYGSIDRALREMVEKGPLELRPEFERVIRATMGGAPLAAALRQASRARPEIFYRQFFDALANAETKGGNVRAVLDRIAKAQRAQTALQRKINAQQASGRLIGALYGVAPTVILVFMRLAGGEGYNEFYTTLIGQIVQVFVVLSGAVTWWLTGRIARRGIYVEENPVALMPPDETAPLLGRDQLQQEKVRW
ncbi:MAG: type II secretion system F family protein [Aggregatilineales bacterium]